MSSFSIKIYGAGSIGNHIAHAARERNWDVLLTDVDENALVRARNEIYPARYGSWDEGISLARSDDATGQKVDVVFVGTPPDTHIDIALNELREDPPAVLIVEKPLCGPDLSGCVELHEQAKATNTFVGVGYNHILAENTRLIQEVIKRNAHDEVKTLYTRTCEHWGGIFKAHPWISGPEETYLGYSARGGGACGEHSHALNLWQHLARLLGLGRVSEVSALLDMRREGNAHYDQLAVLNLVTEQGLPGIVIQDVVTSPTEKMGRIQWAGSYAEWHVNYRPGMDAVVEGEGDDEPRVTTIEKTRADDFRVEMEHIEKLLTKELTESPIALERGLETMMVIAAAFRSAETKKTVEIDWDAGYRLEALKN